MSVAHLLNQQSIGYRRELARLGDCTNAPEPTRKYSLWRRVDLKPMPRP